MKMRVGLRCANPIYEGYETSAPGWGQSLHQQQMNKYLSLIISVVLVGCALRNMDKPAPGSYELWKKDGVSKINIQIDMLECGYPNPIGYFEPSIPDGGLNAFAMAGRCLKSMGYEYVGTAGISCDSRNFAGLQACQGDEPAWAPDHQRRLNSPFCREYPKADACKPPGSATPTDAELKVLELTKE